MYKRQAVEIGIGLQRGVVQIITLHIHLVPVVVDYILQTVEDVYKRQLLMIPSVAIHMNREVNDKASCNKQVDMLPVLGGACEEGALKKLIAEELQVSEEQILGSDLFLYVREKEMCIRDRSFRAQWFSVLFSAALVWCNMEYWNAIYRLTGKKPVSYTHLDVYKRQLLTMPTISVTEFIRVPTISV